ncbi:winged helix-turn-helix domain-containing protein [Halalkalicoccus sp. NIPERK01]|uniref:winged helix-turn-helix domain-containing protein n=1 Tax=Halalkalicoccus sp. NIPERK01 TaxID=3053469 RepID=UPI00256EB840|nr:winged helix-turn-helix domain-containing protein [Halalkalicoccus sp. NIPERK01]MDL5360585.1 winged helix-turn-helix domain-containing protein [Halalkalicoccus sp. NIPERK01]
MIGNNAHEPDEPTTYAVISTDCSTLLDTLGNRSARTILTEAAGEPVGIDDLLEACEVSRTTIYRRVNDLVDLGLLEESMTLAEGNQQRRRFRTTGREITLQIGPNGFEARIRSNDSGTLSDDLLLDDASLERFRIALSGKDLRFRIETNGDEAVDETDPLQ